MNGMQKRNILISSILLTFCSMMQAQDAYAPILETVEQRSTLLQAYGAVREALTAEARTGLTPSNPEIEAGYLFGQPETGDRKDISISQSFDFPTVYARKGKLADAKINSAGYQYLAQRQEILLEAKQLCICLIYSNAHLKICGERLESARRTNDAYRKMAQNGTANAIETSKAASAYSVARLDYDSELAEHQRLLAELSRMCGGETVHFDLDSFPDVELPADFDIWWNENRENHPVIKYMQSAADQSEQEVKVALSSWIPKFSIGYMGEFIPVEKYQGITAGITIPLWEDKGKVRAAKASEKAAKASLQDAVASLENSMRALYLQCQALQRSLSDYEAANSSDAAALLQKALAGGEISLLTYIQEYDYLYNATLRRLEAARDLALSYAQLTAASL